MVDFTKLNNPEIRAQMKERAEREQAAQTLVNDAAKRAIKFVTSHKDRLALKDSRFVDSLSSQMRGFRGASYAQTAWLASIEDRLVQSLGFITITSGMRGYFAVHMRASEGFCEPQQSGIGSYKSAVDALPEAKGWAESEELYVMHTHEGSVTLLSEALAQLKAAQRPIQTVAQTPSKRGVPDSSDSVPQAGVVRNVAADESKRVTPIAITAARARMRRAA